MLIWLRLGIALAASLVLLTVLDALGLWALFSSAPPDEPQTAQGRSGEFVWMMIFLLVMATSLLAAARRGAGCLRRSLVRPSR